MHGPGGEFARLAEVIERLGRDYPEQQAGVCVDSCHAFAAGFDLRDTAEVDRLVQELESTVGVGRVRLLHVNDARDEAGSHRDRHEHVGEGKIGGPGLKNFLTHPQLSTLPFILETPWASLDRDKENLRQARILAGIPRET